MMPPEVHAALHSVAMSAEGQKLLAWLKARVAYGRTRFVPGDIHLTCVYLGEQNPVNELVAALQIPVGQVSQAAPAEDFNVFEKGNDHARSEEPAPSA